MKVFDSHVHFWDPRTTPRAVSRLVRLLGYHHGLVNWVAKRVFPRDAVSFFGSPVYITREYLPTSFDKDTGEHQVLGLVHVEAGWEGKGDYSCVDETRWIEQISHASRTQVAAIVGRVNLEMGIGVRDVLDRHVAASPKIRGVRDMLSWHPDSKVLNGARRSELTKSDSWRKGFAQLEAYDLHFEATIYSNQLSELSELAEAFPNVPIVVSHLATPVGCGGPYLGIGTTKAHRDEHFKRWEAGMLKLASSENVRVKLSGLNMPAVGFGFESRQHRPSNEEVAEQNAPFVQTAVRAFGIDRCMFGSNYPVDKVAVDYKTLVNGLVLSLGESNTSVLDAIFCSNASRFYRFKGGSA